MWAIYDLIYSNDHSASSRFSVPIRPTTRSALNSCQLFVACSFKANDEHCNSPDSTTNNLHANYVLQFATFLNTQLSAV